MFRSSACVAVTLLVLCGSAAAAPETAQAPARAQPPAAAPPALEPFGFRGNGQGRFPDATPVTEWGPAKNVVWKTPMPNWSNACPALCGDRLFVCSEPTTLLCVSLADGKILWQESNNYLDILTDPAERAMVGGSDAVAAKLRAQMNEKAEQRVQAADVWSKDKTHANLKKVLDLDLRALRVRNDERTLEFVRAVTSPAHNQRIHPCSRLPFASPDSWSSLSSCCRSAACRPSAQPRKPWASR